MALDQKCTGIRAKVSVAFVTVSLGAGTAFNRYAWHFSAFFQCCRMFQRDLQEGGVRR